MDKEFERLYQEAKRIVDGFKSADDALAFLRDPNRDKDISAIVSVLILRALPKD